MRRHREKVNRHIEKEKMEYEIVKSLMDEIRFHKEQLWKITYYSVIVYAGLFTVINFFSIRIESYLINGLSMEYYIIVLLSASFANKMLIRQISDIMACRRVLNNLNCKILKIIFEVTHHNEYEQFFGLILVIYIGYLFTVAYIYSKYGINNFFFKALPEYLIIEVMVLYSRYKHYVSRKLFFRYDIYLDGFYLITIFAVHVVFQYGLLVKEII